MVSKLPERKYLVLALILVFALTLSIPMRAGRTYNCIEFGCPLLWVLCYSDQTPRRVGTCMFQCYQGGEWTTTIFCPIQEQGPRRK